MHESIVASGRDADRLVSLDAFRGFAIASMILVNNPGDWSHVYRQLDHAAWHGWTFTDTIFPAFLFASGFAMALTIARRRASGIAEAVLYRQFIVRAAILFAIGLLLNAIPSFDVATLRVPGVLQRIALCIAIAAPLVIASGEHAGRALSIAIVAMLTLYSIAMLALPVPGFDGVVAAGVLEPGRDTGAFVDRWLLGGHLWPRSKTWDPEGLLSTLPAVCTMLFGAIAGTASPKARSSGFAIAGLVSLALGAALDATLMPINKNLWTPSYCLWMNGLALLAFAAFYRYLDSHSNTFALRAPVFALGAARRVHWSTFALRAPVFALGAARRANADSSVRNLARWFATPLTMFGVNALSLFVVSGLLARLLDAIRIAGPDGVSTTLKSRLYAPIAGLPVSQETASLLFAVLFDLAMLGLAYVMWKKRWLIRV